MNVDFQKVSGVEGEGIRNFVCPLFDLWTYRNPSDRSSHPVQQLPVVVYQVLVLHMYVESSFEGIYWLGFNHHWLDSIWCDLTLSDMTFGEIAFRKFIFNKLRPLHSAILLAARWCSARQQPSILPNTIDFKLKRNAFHFLFSSYQIRFITIKITSSHNIG